MFAASIESILIEMSYRDVVGCVVALVDTVWLIGMMVADTLVADMWVFVDRALLLDKMALMLSTLQDPIFQ